MLLFVSVHYVTCAMRLVLKYISFLLSIRFALTANDYLLYILAVSSYRVDLMLDILSFCDLDLDND